MKFRELVRAIEDLGYSFSHGTGGHQIYKHPKAIRALAICKNNEEIGPILFKKYIKQAKLNLKNS